MWYLIAPKKFSEWLLSEIRVSFIIITLLLCFVLFSKDRHASTDTQFDSCSFQPKVKTPTKQQNYNQINI